MSSKGDENTVRDQPDRVVTVGLMQSSTRRQRERLLVGVLVTFILVGIGLFGLLVWKSENPDIVAFAFDMSQIWLGALVASLSSVIAFYFSIKE